MIKDRNIANDAQIQLHKILGSAGLLLTGELFWVGNSGDAAYNAMRDRVVADHLFTSIDAAVGSCVASRGDVIAVMEGHNEAISAAAQLALDVAGITIVFLGTGTSHAKITFGTDAGADMDVDAANITLVRPKFVAGIDSLTGPIDINATDFTMIDVEYHDADDIETLDAVIADSSAARLKIDGYKYFCGAETGDLKQSHIQLNGCDDIELKNIDIRGDFYVGNIENVTDEVLNARFENWYLENLNTTPQPALYLDADATGSCKNVKLKIASGSTYVSNVGKMSWDDRCEGFMGDGYAGEPIGTVLGTGLEGKIDVIDEYHDVPAQNNALNAQINEVIGNKTDTAAEGAVTTTDTLVGYIKQLVTAAIAEAAQSLKIDGVTLATAPVANSLAAFIASGGTGLGQELPDSQSLVDLIGDFTGPHDGAEQDDNIKAILDLILADSISISGGALPAAPTANSLAAYLASGGTALGTELADSKSIIDALGFDGSAFVAGGLGMYLPRCVEKSDGAVLSGLDPLFTITGGPVRCKIVGHVTTLIGGAANLRLQHITTDPAATVDLNAGAVAVNDNSVGTIYHNLGATSVFTPSGGLGFVLLDPVTVEETELILAPGVVQCLGSAAQSGVIKWYMTYKPLSPNSAVVAAA